jgi:hypothetical protein
MLLLKQTHPISKRSPCPYVCTLLHRIQLSSRHGRHGLSALSGRCGACAPPCLL